MKEFKSLKEALTDFSLMFGGGTEGPTSSAPGPSRIVFGTVVRAAPIEDGGELVLLDWETKKVDAKVAVRPRNPTIEEDPNPRGNGRGCRGIRRMNGQVIASSYHTLECYSPRLDLVDTVSDGLMVGLHEIETTDQGTVWVTSTAIDAAVEYDLEEGKRMRALWPREMDALQDALGLEPLMIDKTADNRLEFLDPAATDLDSHLHLNAVEVYNGSVYGLFNAYGVVANLTDEEVVIRHDKLQGGHNLEIVDDDLAIVNDSFGKAVRFYDLERGTLRHSIDLTRYRWVRDLIRWKIPPYWAKEAARKVGLIEDSVAKPLFVRGLVRRGDTLFVGVSPAAILQIDWTTGELEDAYQYSSDVHVCVHGLEVIE